jgi:hypothetical protein
MSFLSVKKVFFELKPGPHYIKPDLDLQTQFDVEYVSIITT